jgi:predicted kinase
MLIAMRGGPGAGKSTLARGLARSLRIPLVDKDDLKDILDPAFDNTHRAGALSYAGMWSVVERQLSVGLSAIADSPLSGGESFHCLRALRERYGVRVVVLSCTCSRSDLWQARLDGRVGDPQYAPHRFRPGWEHVGAWNACYGIVPAWDPHLVLDTVAPVEAVLDQALAFLALHNESADAEAANRCR